MVKMTADNNASADDIIDEIMNQYPEDEWLDRCRAALPNVDDAQILTAFEIFSGGDVLILKDN
jgi:hypothetical protein